MITKSTNYERTVAALVAGDVTPSPAAMGEQIGRHIANFTAFLDTLRVSSCSDVADLLRNESSRLLKEVANQLMSETAIVEIFDREQALGSLCCSEATANSIAYLGGFDKVRADEAVMAAAESSVQTVVQAPDLTPFLGVMPGMPALGDDLVDAEVLPAQAPT